MREVQRKLDTLALAAGSAHAGVPFNPKVICDLLPLIERAERIRTQQRRDKNKLCALHAPEVECLSKNKARKP